MPSSAWGRSLARPCRCALPQRQPDGHGEAFSSVPAGDRRSQQRPAGAGPQPKGTRQVSLRVPSGVTGGHCWMRSRGVIHSSIWPFPSLVAASALGLLDLQRWLGPHTAALAAWSQFTASTCRGKIAAGRLVPVLDGRQPAADLISIIYPQSRHLSPRVRAFVDFMVEALANDRDPGAC
ncbi:hypothetical protein F7R01_10130 [Pseudomonas argentinensis]|nr:hypothetical protein F7R01_10130 [Pseudomonas argentinensis]